MTLDILIMGFLFSVGVLSLIAAFTVLERHKEVKVVAIALAAVMLLMCFGCFCTNVGVLLAFV